MDDLEEALASGDSKRIWDATLKEPRLWQLFRPEHVIGLPSAIYIERAKELASFLNKREVDAAGLSVLVSPLSLAAVWLGHLPLTLWLAQLANDHDSLSRPRALVGIVGAAGAGKSVLSQVLRAALHLVGVPCEVLGMDAYHYTNTHLASHFLRSEGGDSVPLKTLKGTPPTINVAGLCADLERARVERSVDVRLPVYDRSLHDPVPEVLRVPPATALVLVEGLFLLHDGDGFSAVAPLLDACVYVDMDPAVSRDRVIARKVSCGRSRADAEAHYARVDEPSAEIIRGGRHKADIVISCADNGEIHAAVCRGRALPH